MRPIITPTVSACVRCARSRSEEDTIYSMVILRGTESREAGPSPAFCLDRDGDFPSTAYRMRGLIRDGIRLSGSELFLSGLEPRPRNGLTPESGSLRKQKSGLAEAGILWAAFPCVSPFRVQGSNPGNALARSGVQGSNPGINIFCFFAFIFGCDCESYYFCALYISLL